MINRVALLMLLALMPVFDVLAKQEGYTYVQSSLAFPWFMFFVFFGLIMIPFFIVIGIAWSKSGQAENDDSDEDTAQSSTASVSPQKSLFNRLVLPTILMVVAIFSILLVVNAYEAMDLMEEYGTAAPTMLNARP